MSEAETIVDREDDKYLSESEGTQSTHKISTKEAQKDDVPERMHLTSDIEYSPEFTDLWKQQEKYIDYLENRLRNDSNDRQETNEGSNNDDAGRREHLLVCRLAIKEQELQELSNQIAELKAAQAPSMSALRTALLDPAVNIIIQNLKKELEATKKKMQETQEELSAWKFTPDSVTGKRLMSKCRQLLQVHIFFCSQKFFVLRGFGLQFNESLYHKLPSTYVGESLYTKKIQPQLDQFDETRSIVQKVASISADGFSNSAKGLIVFSNYRKMRIWVK